MSATYINLDPIAQSIRSFGSGLANNALKKAQLDRQLKNDIVAFDKAQSDIAYNDVRREHAQQRMDWERQLAGGYDPNLLNPQQRNMVAVNTMAPRNVANDSIMAADKILNPDGSGGSKGWMDRFSIREVMPLYTDPVTGEVNRDQFNADYQRLRASGKNPTNGLFYDLVTGVLKLPELQAIIAQQNPQAPAATNLPTQPANTPKVGPIDIPSMQAVIEQMYRIGDISKDQAIEMAKMYGIKL